MTQWCGAAAGVLAVLALVAAARLRAVTVTLRGRLAGQEQELDRLRAALADELARRTAENAAVQQEQDLNSATRRAFLSVARRILVMAHDQQAGLDEMERTHDDPALLDGLLKADHAAAQQARLAQTLAVLCGARAGRHWPEPVALEDVVRGAQSRILPFQRVVVRSRLETAVVGAAAEALIHAVAELLDNATRYSPPSTQVFVTLMSVHNGAVVEIDDCGVGMPEHAVEKAAAALAGGGSLEVSRLGEVPQLGLAAVGRLAEQYGFRVTLSSAPSPYGGVRVVVLLPNVLLTEPLPTVLPPSASSAPALPPGPPSRVPTQPRTSAGTSAGTAPGRAGTAQPRSTAAARAAGTPPTGELPRRANRRSTGPAKAPATDQAPATAGERTTDQVATRSADQAQAFMAMFQAGTASGRSAAREGLPSDAPDPSTGPADPAGDSPQLPQRSGDFDDHQS
ncbi:ATP-binding protein [Kitasatospora sp. NPDC049258]|uniref:sensor histidine kinase n=1 Tax=Kitasatospora sp. NPDC049258 TaxID=3155394 RepID=UPI0034219303